MESYELYCLADRRFYETPTNRGAEHPDFALCVRPVQAGWDHVPDGTWMHYAPSDLRRYPRPWAGSIPAQGRTCSVDRPRRAGEPPRRETPCGNSN